MKSNNVDVNTLWTEKETFIIILQILLYLEPG
jgi:hypothetical protein